MKIEDIKTPQDILLFMKNNIRYGWLDINGEEHINNIKDYRELYRISSIQETLSHGIGTCIEQVNLMSKLLDRLNIDNKMFCTRIYGDNNELNSHMHCFILYYLNDRVYQIEHPNGEKAGIYVFKDEDTAIEEISYYYMMMTNDRVRSTTQFYDVEPNLSFDEFNNYINSLDKKLVKRKK